jgi:hypothetical protein
VNTGQQKSGWRIRQLFWIETRNQETRGDGSVSHTPWVYAGEDWRVGAPRSCIVFVKVSYNSEKVVD